jgi:hypothetical protein
MVYRSSVDPDAAARRAEVEEIAAVSRDSRARARRAAVGVALAVGSFFALLLIAPAATPRRLVRHCHQVELRWENAPWIPASGWQACEWR